MDEAVEVVCTARLHLGFLDLSFTLGRRFGSIGLCARRARNASPARRRANEIRVQGAERPRAAAYLAAIAAHLGIAGGARADGPVLDPRACGLGSGTQLALGIAAALRRCMDCQPNPGEDARVLGRGNRSGIGIFLFQQGGFVVDGGRGASAPPLLSRLAVPDDWRILLVQDHAHRGCPGQEEVAAFAALAPLPDRLSSRICRLVLMQAMPAVAEDDLDSFGAAVTEMQAIAGDHFAPAQGGRFTEPAVAAALDHARAAGATGIGQSSWGPSGFAFMRGEAEAER